MICPDREFHCPYCRPDGSCSCAWCNDHGNNWTVTTVTTGHNPDISYRNATQAECLWFQSAPKQLTLEDEIRRQARETAQRELESWPP